MFSCPFGFGEYDEALGILICRPTGELTGDLARDLATCHECIEKAGLRQVNRFHDLRGINSLHLKFGEILRLCRVEPREEQTKSRVKACYLVSNPSVYGTLRMFQALAEGTGAEVHVGYDIRELADILGVDAARLGTVMRSGRDT